MLSGQLRPRKPSSDLAVPACFFDDQPRHADSWVATGMQPQPKVCLMGAGGFVGAIAGELGVTRRGRRGGPMASALCSMGRRHLAYRTQSGMVKDGGSRIRGGRKEGRIRVEACYVQVVGSAAARPPTRASIAGTERAPHHGASRDDHEGDGSRIAHAGGSRGGVHTNVVRCMGRLPFQGPSAADHRQLACERKDLAFHGLCILRMGQRNAAVDRMGATASESDAGQDGPSRRQVVPVARRGLAEVRVPLLRSEPVRPSGVHPWDHAISASSWLREGQAARRATPREVDLPIPELEGHGLEENCMLPLRSRLRLSDQVGARTPPSREKTV